GCVGGDGTSLNAIVATGDRRWTSASAASDSIHSPEWASFSLSRPVPVLVYTSIDRGIRSTIDVAKRNSIRLATNPSGGPAVIPDPTSILVTSGTDPATRTGASFPEQASRDGCASSTA